MGDVVVWWKIEGATKPELFCAPPGSFWADVKNHICKLRVDEGVPILPENIHVRRALWPRALLGFANCPLPFSLVFLPAAQAFWCKGGR